MIGTAITDSLFAASTTAFPLLFVIFVTACKQGYEDILRHRADRRVNSLPVTVFQRGCAREIRCQQIAVGDIVRVNRDEDVPCDLVILQSSELSGKCYVTTSNLDGESNLKTLQVPRMFLNLDAARIIGMKATITCQNPAPGLYMFEGKIQASIPGTDEDEQEATRSGPLTIDNLALGGARLKNVDFIVGCAVYTGKDTKLSRNSKMSIQKFSTAEKTINKYILVLMFILAIEVIFCTAMKIVRAKKDELRTYPMSLNQVDGSYTKLLADMVIFVGLYNYVVPISLYVTIEMQKLLGAFLFGCDLGMYDELSDQPAIANTSDINEDLGQVEYLFSDKTGTLTENNMIFRRCFVDGSAYCENDCDGRLYLLPANGNAKEAQKIDTWSPEVWHFMLSLSLCHCVHIAPPLQRAKAELNRVEFRESLRLRKPVRLNSSLMMDPALPEYQATSADEKSLVEVAARCGVIFLGETDEDEIEIDARGRRLYYQRLDVLEFTSDRKRMSVIVKDTAGVIWLYCKGADSSMFPLLARENLEAAKACVADFSMRGLRTLVVGFKRVAKEEYERLGREVNEARQTIGKDRTPNVERAYYKLETGLALLGVTAVEDRLQEGVAETMEKLRAAGIKVWVLTGDKAETAENIAFLCGHFQKGTTILRLMDQRSTHSCCVLLTSFERKMKIEPLVRYGLLVDGASAATALNHCPSLLRNVAMSCEAVVCCRMSPLQKSEIVHLVKRAKGRPLTAAIGDGGNDVSMIQEAHVGLGVTGKEGRQAAMSADFAFAKFAHLQRVLLVHGHWYYLRVAVLVQYFFYKNVVFITPQLLYNIFADYSAKALYDRLFLMCYNVIFTSIPILVYGVYEQNYSDKTLLTNPQLYRLNRRNIFMSNGHFVLWMLMATWQACVVYFMPFYFYKCNSVMIHESDSAEHWQFGTCIFYVVTIIANLQILLLSSYWTFAFTFSIFLSEMLFFAGTFAYSYFDWQYDGQMLEIFTALLSSYTFWLLTLLIVVVSLIPTLFFVIWKNKRPSELRSQLKRRARYISGIARRPVEPTSATIPNRRSSTFVPWRGYFSFGDDNAF
ncbi:phospholipid-transporting ATPase IF-like isoform X2 [Phymastichus coffea]|nr:phospholipid-transporting ATPase IF-like isoform X2 [Phymastichus coffea]XP_058801757.1 phospholipid-transporting ATPase IF-like isoform X2 [Phymastichus coffea]XP_058801758.1 phospholipid-transporting ATPase IF-like isoform X2 [Phymastichus coffea]